MRRKAKPSCQTSIRIIRVVRYVKRPPQGVTIGMVGKRRRTGNPEGNKSNSTRVLLAASG